MDNIDGCDEDEHDHHVEGSNTSCNDTFLIVPQVLNSIKCGKNKESKTNKCRLS